MKQSIMKNRLAFPALLALCLLLGACGALPDKPQRSALYDFGPGPASIAAPADAAAARRLPPLVLSEIDANSRLDGTQILYRLAYSDPNELRPYSQSRWSQPPAQLLRERIKQQFSGSRSVLASDEGSLARGGGRTVDSLRVSLEEFSQVFDSPSQSFGLVRISATLARSNGNGERVLLQRSFVARTPAPSNDAAGGVRALAAASDAVVAELAAWVDQGR